MGRPAFTCGFRTPALYICEYVPDEVPIGNFIPCPVPFIDLKEAGIPNIGMVLKQRFDVFGNPMTRLTSKGEFEEVWDIWDVVSGQDNPSPSVFIEQTKRFGASRKMPETLVKDPNFKKLKVDDDDPTLSSRHIMLHPFAVIEDPEPFYQQRTHREWCPASIQDHDDNITTWEMCAALWWESFGKIDEKHRSRAWDVEVPLDWEKKGYNGPSFRYTADRIPKDVEPKFLAGIMLSMPLFRMEIPIDDSGADEHERLQQLLERGGWQYPTEITED